MPQNFPSRKVPLPVPVGRGGRRRKENLHRSPLSRRTTPYASISGTRKREPSILAGEGRGEGGSSPASTREESTAQGGTCNYFCHSCKEKGRCLGGKKKGEVLRPSKGSTSMGGGMRVLSRGGGRGRRKEGSFLLRLEGAQRGNF